MERKKIFVGIDDGHDETKIVFFQNGKVHQHKIKSQAKAGLANQVSLADSVRTIFGYTTRDSNYILGQVRDSDSTAFDDYPVSDMNRVIVHHALRTAGIDGNYDVICVTGLPINRYYRRNVINKELVRAKKANLLVDTPQTDDETLLCRVIKHDVLSEAIAAWFDIIYTRGEDGRLVKNEEEGKRIAIIDIGGRTTDVAVIESGNIDFDRSGTLDVGALNVRDELSRAIENSFNIVPTAIQLNEALQDQRIKLYGKYHDVSKVIRSARVNIANRIESMVKKMIKNASDLDRVVFVGGTVNDLRPYLEGWFIQSEFAASPSYANASGMSKCAELLASR